MEPSVVRSRWSVVLERTVRELQGTSCTQFEDIAPDKKEIACTRSFGHPVTQLSDLQEAVSEFASRAAEKLRRQHSHANQVLCFIRTSPFRKEKQYSRSVCTQLPESCSDTHAIVQAAVQGLKTIYKSGYNYAKAGVMLIDLQPANRNQLKLDIALNDDPVTSASTTNHHADPSRLMQALDAVNQRYGRGSLLLASAGLAGTDRVWSMKQERRTPQYTTRWKDIPIARA
jgi:DNA polymerase V